MRTQNSINHWRLITLAASLLLIVGVATTLFYQHSRMEAAPPQAYLNCPYNHSLIIKFKATQAGTAYATVWEENLSNTSRKVGPRSKAIVGGKWYSFYFGAHSGWKYYQGFLQGPGLSYVSYSC
jgi:hypothetical protein